MIFDQHFSLKSGSDATILSIPSGGLNSSLAVMTMTPTILLVIAVCLVVVMVVAYLVRRAGQTGRTFELGAVSTRWLSELRRDEPWTRS